MTKNRFMLIIGIIGLVSVIAGVYLMTNHKTPWLWVPCMITYLLAAIFLFPLTLKQPEATFEELEERRWNWAKKIFPEATAESSLIKAEKEMEEIRELLFFRKTQTHLHNDDALIEEYVDEFMCIFDSARRAGITPRQIKLGYHKKIEKNIARKWVKNSDNTYSHVKATTPSVFSPIRDSDGKIVNPLKPMILLIALFLGACTNTYDAEYRKVIILNQENVTVHQRHMGPRTYKQVTVTDSKKLYYLNFAEGAVLPFKNLDTVTALILN